MDLSWLHLYYVFFWDIYFLKITDGGDKMRIMIVKMPKLLGSIIKKIWGIKSD